MGGAWTRHVVAMSPEFGPVYRRDQRHDGEDHGTGTVAVILGGANEAGRLADGPG